MITNRPTMFAGKKFDKIEKNLILLKNNLNKWIKNSFDEKKF